ncbi:hypothetical protein R5R35_007335 [Gryllus longicercus]|uniref:UNC93-like protein n=1 Tax=Gryllus longicercus TaxID=2509291 RepID=A0AAN9VKR9_9ORTH
MASDNPGFVDTENTTAPRHVRRVERVVDTTPQIAEPSGVDEKNDSSALPAALAEDNATRTEAVEHGGLQDLTERLGPTVEGDETGTHLSSTQGEAHKAGQLVSGSPVNGSPKNESPANGSPVNRSPKNESPANGSLAYRKTRNGPASVTSDPAENGKVANGLNGAALNGAMCHSKAEGTGDAGNGLNGALALNKGKADGDGGVGEQGGAPAYPAGEAGRMLRNAVGVGVVFMVHFTATLGVTHLQSSVNKEQGLGTSALAAQYAGLVLSSLVLAVFIISKLGCKWTIVMAILCNVPYMVAQIYPHMYTLVPAAFLMGLAVAPLWSAKCTYLCVVSEARAALTGRALSAVRDQVIGVFFMVFLLSMVWGNLVSSLVLSHGESSPTNASVQGLCGVDFCPNSDAAKDNPNLERPPQEKITLIIGIYIGFMLLAALIAACYVDSLKRYSEGQRASSASGLSTRGLLTATLALHRRREMLLLVPLSLWLGVDYAFIEAEYTASFVACAWGIQNIGYVIICYGLLNSGMALATGWIVARAGRRPVVLCAAVMHAALMGGVLAWRPSPDHKLLFFVVAAIWGAADGHWAVQLNSLYAILFPNMEEAAYSNFRLWQSIGFVIAFSYSHYLCTVYKLYIVLALLVVGVAGYLGIEYTRPHKARLTDG